MKNSSFHCYFKEKPRGQKNYEEFYDNKNDKVIYDKDKTMKIDLKNDQVISKLIKEIQLKKIRMKLLN